MVIDGRQYTIITVSYTHLDVYKRQALAWSLAETKMRIVCLEQGGWTKPTDYPSNGRDWEARVTTDFSPNPHRPGRPED